ncbi:MAG TPA: ATP-binding cassette domain-containing protein [Clostridia bacterium]|nr:ATP-binding cassette domain-containing protein [Clostridia bacterium]
MGIEIKNIKKSFEDKIVLDGISAKFPNRGIVALSGDSGSGKTTLIRIIAGLETADSGEIKGLDGLKVSYVFQEDRLLPQLTVLENVSVVGDEKTAREWLDKMELSNELDKKPFQLSGGMKRRVALARALTFDGDILMLDEPFKGLELRLKEKIIDIIKTISDNRLVILVTHELSETQVANRIIRIDKKA